MAPRTKWVELRLTPPGTRMAVAAGRYQIHLRIPPMFRGAAAGMVRSWGYKLRGGIRDHPSEPGVQVVDVEIPHADAVTITDWTIRAYQAT